MTGEPRCQTDGHSQLQDAAEQALPFARPSSRAGTSTMAANTTQTPCSPFARPGSRAGSNKGPADNIQGSPLSSASSRMFPRDNTSTSSDLIDTDLDAEVANFTGQQKQPQEPLPSTSGVKANSQVLFQPIVPTYATLVQHRDQALFNSSLNLIDDSPRPQTSGSAARMPQPRAPHTKMPPTPYVNQVMVNQHMDVQPTHHAGFQQARKPHSNNNIPQLVPHHAQQMLSQHHCLSSKLHLLTLEPKVKMDKV